MHLKSMFFTGLLVLGFWTASAAGSPPPRTAHYAGAQTSQLRQQLLIIKRQQHYLAIGCFHVAPRQFVCPLPAPKRS
ncbi:MAG TPA: hypothetical protein VNH41_01385 [Steroidobacteraceae bacterium]|nr:hypothetical protein [Steroidobacteraceae bacterium]